MTTQGLYISLLFLLVWIPLPHGGDRFWEIGPVAIGSFILLGIWSIKQWRSKSPLPIIIIYNLVPLLLLAFWLLYVLFHVLPLPFNSLSFLSPESFYLKSFAHFDQFIPSSSLSIDPSSTLLGLIKYTSYIALFFLTLVLCNTRNRIRTLAQTLFFTGFALSFYSLVNHYTNGAFSLNEPVPPWGDSWSKITRGTFSNQNHFAAFMEMTIPLGIGLLLSAEHERYKNNNLKSKLSCLLNYIMSISTIYILFIIIMLIALVFTASRGGNIAFIAAMILTTVFFYMCIKKNNNIGSILLILIIPIIMLIFAGSGDYNLSYRLTKKGFNEHGRDAMRDSSYNLIADFPIFGSGPSTYPLIYQTYKAPKLGTSVQSKHAHNEYLELLSNQGILGFSIFCVSIFLFIMTIIKGIRSRRDPLMRGMLYGTLFGITSVLIHALVEFHFHIPAIAIYFFILLAIGLIASNKKYTLSDAYYQRP